MNETIFDFDHNLRVSLAHRNIFRRFSPIENESSNQSAQSGSVEREQMIYFVFTMRNYRHRTDTWLEHCFLGHLQ